MLAAEHAESVLEMRAGILRVGVAVSDPSRINPQWRGRVAMQCVLYRWLAIWAGLAPLEMRRA